jgi:hypothetical protein
MRPNRHCVAMDLTCSSCAIESKARPLIAADNNTSNRWILAVLLVTSTTVTTPRPRHVAVALALTLPRMTAGRWLFASLLRTDDDRRNRFLERHGPHVQATQPEK